MDKKTYKALDISWRVIAAVIFVLGAYTLIRINQGIPDKAMSLVVIISLWVYALVSILIFLITKVSKKK